MSSAATVTYIRRYAGRFTGEVNQRTVDAAKIRD